MELKLRLFILLLSFLIINANFSLESKRNYISYKINAQETKEEVYILQVVNKNGDIYVMSSEKYNSNQYKRSIMILENKTSSILNKRINYLSDFDLCGAESFIFGVNSEFIFTTTVISDNPAEGSYDAFNINKIITYQGIYDAYGFRRVLITAEPYYYMINLYSDYKTLHLRKIKFTFDSNNVPDMEIVKEIKDTSYIYPKTKMISCDITNDKNFIFCALYYLYQNKGPTSIWIFLYNSELQYKSMTSFTSFDNFNIDYFVKLVNLKDDKFFAIVPKDEKIAEFMYFKYDVNTGDISFIYQEKVENSQLSSHFDSNDVIAFPPDKIIKIYAGEKIIITIFQLYENDTILSIKIYNMNLFSDVANSGQIRINMIKNSIFATYLAYENNKDTPRAGYFFINYPNYFL